MEKQRKKRIADQEEILQYLTSVIRGDAIGKEKLGVGRGAEQIIDRKPTTQERIRAAEQLGKRYGMWTDRHEVEHKLPTIRSEEHTSELQSRGQLVCRRL